VSIVLREWRGGQTQAELTGNMWQGVDECGVKYENGMGYGMGREGRKIMQKDNNMNLNIASFLLWRCVGPRYEVRVQYVKIFS
jgi:hypothetical protein